MHSASQHQQLQKVSEPSMHALVICKKKMSLSCKASPQLSKARLFKSTVACQLKRVNAGGLVLSRRALPTPSHRHDPDRGRAAAARLLLYWRRRCCEQRLYRLANRYHLCIATCSKAITQLQSTQSAIFRFRVHQALGVIPHYSCSQRDTSIE